MHLKDHYKTLHLHPTATLPEVKKAYRKLAQQYHPDKNEGDPYAAVYFAEIKEAYETLTHPVKKYTYLQQRWYNRATGNEATQEIITPVHILKQALDFEQYTASLDVFRMDKDSIYQYIDDLLNPEAMARLLEINETAINQQIFITLLKPMHFLTTQKAQLLTPRLTQLAAGNTQLSQQLTQLLQNLKQKEQWEKYRWILVLCITAAICGLIWFAGRR